MEEKPPEEFDETSPEGRRHLARHWREGLQAQIEAQIGRGTRLARVVARVAAGTWHDGFIHAGNLAYMAILALFPFFITVSWIFSLLGEQGRRGGPIDALLVAVPPSVAGALGPVAHGAVEARSGWLLWAGGLVGLWTVGSLIETIRDILRRAYGTHPAAVFWRHRLLSTMLVVASVVALLFSLLAQVAIGGAEQVIDAYFPRLTGIAETLSTSRAIPAVILYGSVWVLFFILTPTAYRARRYPKWPGALLVTGWWVMTMAALPPVLRRFFTYDLTYGSLAGVMIALFFFWLVGLGMVVGAELNAALAVTPEERGLVRHDADNTGETLK